MRTEIIRVKQDKVKMNIQIGMNSDTFWRTNKSACRHENLLARINAQKLGKRLWNSSRKSKRIQYEKPRN